MPASIAAQAKAVCAARRIGGFYKVAELQRVGASSSRDAFVLHAKVEGFWTFLQKAAREVVVGFV